MWSQAAEQEGGTAGHAIMLFICGTWKKLIERVNVGGVSIRSGNGAPSRKG